MQTVTLPTNNIPFEGFNPYQSPAVDLFKYETIYKNTNNGFAVEFRRQMIDLHQSGYKQTEIAKMLNCSIGVVNKWIKRYEKGDLLEEHSRAPINREVKNTHFHKFLITETIEKFPFYGSRRVSHEIEKEYGIKISHVTISQMMKELAPKKDAVIPQQIEIDEPDHIWHMDMMYMRIAKGRKQYVFGIIDACTRRVMATVNYDRFTAINAIDCLKKAIKNNNGKAPKILYTDNGRTFISGMFEGFCKEIGVYHHRTNPGSPWENGKIERLFGTLRREWIAYRRYMIPESLRASLEEFREWFNNEREIQKLGYKTPMRILEEKTQ